MLAGTYTIDLQDTGNSQTCISFSGNRNTARQLQIFEIVASTVYFLNPNKNLYRNNSKSFCLRDVQVTFWAELSTLRRKMNRLMEVLSDMQIKTCPRITRHDSSIVCSYNLTPSVRTVLGSYSVCYTLLWPAVWHRNRTSCYTFFLFDFD